MWVKNNNNLRNSNKLVKQARLIQLFKFVLDGEKSTLDKPLKKKQEATLLVQKL